MGAYTGRTDNVPKQLKKGMAVVVWIKPRYPLIGREENTKLIRGKWLKATIVTGNKDFLIFESAGLTFSTIVSGLIIIRSTSLADNPTSNERDKIKRNEAKQRRRALAKAAK